MGANLMHLLGIPLFHLLRHDGTRVIVESERQLVAYSTWRQGQHTDRQDAITPKVLSVRMFAIPGFLKCYVVRLEFKLYWATLTSSESSICCALINRAHPSGFW